MSVVPAFRELGYEAHKDVIKVAQSHHGGVFVSQVSEDVFNRMKNAACIKAKKKYRVLEKPWELPSVATCSAVCTDTRRSSSTP